MAVFNPLVNLYLKTASYSHLLKMMEEESSVVISGPKGTGKSFSLVAVFAYYSTLKKPCLFFTQESIRQSDELMKYLKVHLERSKDNKLS